MAEEAKAQPAEPCVQCRNCRAFVPLSDSYGPPGRHRLRCGVCGDAVLVDGGPAKTAPHLRITASSP